MVEPRQGEYLFLLDDGNVIEKTVIARLLRTAALRSGLDPSVMDTHSLRAGGCTAMADAGFPEHEIQRRGRWASACWKIYCWGTRALGSDVANRMAKASLAICSPIFGRRCLQHLRWLDVLNGPLPSAFLGSVGPPRPGGWAEISPSVVKSRALLINCAKRQASVRARQ